MWLRDAGDAGVKGAGKGSEDWETKGWTSRCGCVLRVGKERERGSGDERLDEQVWLRDAGDAGDAGVKGAGRGSEENLKVLELRVSAGNPILVCKRPPFLYRLPLQPKWGCLPAFALVVEHVGVLAPASSLHEKVPRAKSRLSLQNLRRSIHLSSLSTASLLLLVNNSFAGLFPKASPGRCCRKVCQLVYPFVL